MPLTKEEIGEIATKTADKVMELKGAAICKCVDWFLVAMTAAEALEHNAGVSDYMGDLHDNLKRILPAKQMEDLEFKHHLLQGYVTENIANMALAGSIGTIRDKCNVDTTKLHNLAKEGFDAIQRREPSTAGSRFMQVKGELLRLAQEICEEEESNPSNPSRVHFNRWDIDGAIGAAKRLKSDSDLYVFATYLGFTIEKRPPPGIQQYVVVHPDGSTETIKPSVGSNPGVKAEEWKLRKAIADTAYGLAHGVKEEDIRKDLTRNPRGKYWFEPEDVDYILKEAKGEGGNPTKEPWQMTLEEYAYVVAKKYGHGEPRIEWIKAGYGETYRTHKTAVKRAISEGEPVSPEVLADYPTLLKGTI